MKKSRRNLTRKEREPYWLQIINAWQSSGKKTEQFCQEPSELEKTPFIAR